MPGQVLRLGTRESPLAMAQTRLVETALRRQWPDLALEIRTFKTQGDIILDTALSKVGDKGLFVKELEVALLDGHIDLAVHSLKDMPGELPDGLGLFSFGEREDARDVLISKTGRPFHELPQGAVIGTSSLRREAQLRHLRPDLAYQNIRGNLQTRLRKLEEGPYDAIVLAAAGVHRLGWHDRITQYFDPQTENLPAVGQGILGVECRMEDPETLGRIRPLILPDVEAVKTAERAVLRMLQGGCQLPLAAHASGSENRFQLKGRVLSPDGTRMVEAEQAFAQDDAQAAGERLGRELLAGGGAEILKALQHT